MLESLWFLPGVMIVGFGGLAFGLVEIDRTTSPHGSIVFSGDGAAARTVLSVLAGSLITVAGVSLSLTVLVLQLASSQFSPRILPSFLGDRLTQVTVGGFVGIFTFSLVTLRSAGGGFVPRLSVTVASALGIGAVVLLVAFIHHVSTMIQVSQIAARLDRATQHRLESLYPEDFGREDGDDASVVAEWRRSGRPHTVSAARSGYVVDADLHALAKRLDRRSARVHVRAVPGDFVTPADTLAEYWGDDPDTAERTIRGTIAVGNERNLDSDLGFGIRQITDVAQRALSPSLNDPTTARTCIGYLRGIIERLSVRSFPGRLRRFEDTDTVVVAERREFADYLHVLVEIGRCAGSAVEVYESLLDACDSVAAQAERAGATARAQAARAVAQAIVEHASDEVRAHLDRAQLRRAASTSAAEAGFAGAARGSSRS